MEAFQILSRGGARFDKNRFKNDVKLFNVRSWSSFPRSLILTISVEDQICQYPRKGYLKYTGRGTSY